MTIDNLDLADSARALADSEPAGTLEHAAAASVAITCATTRDADQARTALAGISPENVRQAALALFDRLSAQAQAH
ncbi:hypothetical protein Aple_021700 [Acrocarpospora pleiomorpha]|uniref:Uncharacterized protein n=1 Tax=Acrocarpospora pleiomorpha TaxID=90975 RepID=A0A5M3XDF5_9ACTN|nr:hypothetical protein [Acrocarpospora pleiomorpha]GES19274.1 hypothetical protein Aple_021700 [Acrocarpospora pleiomorpha]